MTICRSTHKKPNCFEELADSDGDQKSPDLVDPSSVTDESGVKPPDSFNELKDSFFIFQQSTNENLSQIGYSFHQVTKSVSNLRNSIAELHSSCQNTLLYSRCGWIIIE